MGSEMCIRDSNYCKQKLAPYKVPKLVEFRKELPMSSIGKPLKRVLREEARRGTPN